MLKSLMFYEVYGDKALMKSIVHKWITCVKKGQDDVEDEACSGRLQHQFVREQIILFHSN